MFGSKRLIGTPVNSRKHNQQSRDLEFTPVGEELSNRSIRQDNDISPLKHTRTRLQHATSGANVMSNLFLENTLHETSFDNTSHSFDTIDSGTHRQEWRPDSEFLSSLKMGVSNPSAYGNDGHHLLTKSSNPLREQHDSLSKLQEENINLKVRLATLTRYFGEEPQETRDLIDHNIELKQNLIEMNNKMNNLNLYIKELEESERDSQGERDLIRQAESIRQSNESLKQSYESLEQSHESLIQSHESIEAQNNDLQLQHEQLVAENNELLNELQSQEDIVNDFKRKLEQNNDEMNTLRDENDMLHEKLDHLRDQNSNDDLKLELKDLNGEIDDLEAQIRSRDQQIHDLESELDLFKSENHELVETVDQLKLQNREINEIVHDLKERNSELLHQHDNEIRSDQQSTQNENIKLRNQLSRLEQNEEKLIDELETLENNLHKSKEEISRDKRVIFELENQLKSKSKSKAREMQQDKDNDNEYIRSLELEREELYDQLLHSQDKIDDIDRQLNSANLELKSLMKNNRHNESDLVKLREANDSLKENVNRLKREIDAKDVEIGRLTAELNNLSLNEKKELVRGSRSELIPQLHIPQAPNPYLQQEIRRLTERNNELQDIVNSMKFTNTSNNDYDSKLSNLIKKNEILKMEIDSKDSEIDKLSLKIKELSRANKMSSIHEDDEKLSMMEEISKLKSKLSLLSIEKENLKEEYSLKLSIIKKQLQQQSTNATTLPSSSYLLESKLEDSLKLKHNLLTKLSQKQDENEQLLIKNEKLLKDNKELEKIMFALEETESKLSKENRLYVKEMADLKQTCKKLMNKLKSQSQNNDETILINDLEFKLQNANQEIDILTKRYLEMRKDLTSKIDHLENSKQKLKQKIIEMSEDSRAAASARLYPSPRNSPSPSSDSRLKIELKENQLKLLKLKTFDQQQTIKDLQTYNQILNKSLNRLNEMMKRNIINIDRVSSKTRLRDSNKPKITFRVLAKFVLASVRFKNRLEELSLNKIYLNGLQKKIRRNELDLM